MTRRRAAEEVDLDKIIEIGHKNEPARDFGQHVMVHREMHDRVREVFSNYPHIVADDALISRVTDLTVTIRDEASTSIEAYLKIGLALLDLETALDEQDDVIDTYFKGQLVPFSKAHASKITTVARDFRAGRYSKATGRSLTPRELPPIMVAYDIRCLSDEEMRIAAQRGLIDPMTSRAAVQTFREEIKSLAITDGTVNQIKLQKELGKLTKKKAGLETQLAMVCIQIDAIKEQIKAQEGQRYLHAAE